MHADGRTSAVRAELHEVTDLMNEPQAVPARSIRRPLAQAGERINDVPGVLDLAEEFPLGTP